MFYDPMGILQPITINFKIFCQQICRKKLKPNEVLLDSTNIHNISIPWKIVNQN